MPTLKVAATSLPKGERSSVGRVVVNTPPTPSMENPGGGFPAWASTHWGPPMVRMPIWPWGQINAKLARDSLFSERNNYVPTCVLFGVRLTWRRWK